MGAASLEIRHESYSITKPKGRIEVFVLFTDVSSTLSALRTAAQLAYGLSARIRLVALQCVPYPLPLDKPPVSVPFLGQKFRTVVDSYAWGAKHEIETYAEVRLCRNRWESLRALLAPQSVVVIGKRPGWWPQLEDGLARKLRAAGHLVVRSSIAKDNHHA